MPAYACCACSGRGQHHAKKCKVEERKRIVRKKQEIRREEEKESETEAGDATARF